MLGVPHLQGLSALDRKPVDKHLRIISMPATSSGYGISRNLLNCKENTS